MYAIHRSLLLEVYIEKYHLRQKAEAKCEQLHIWIEPLISCRELTATVM